MQATTDGQTKMFLVLVALGVVFGSAFLAVKVLIGVLTPAQVVAWRLVLASAAFVLILALRGDLPGLNRQLLAGGALLAVFDCFVPYGLIAWASQDIDSGMAAILMSTLPLFTALFAARSSIEERLSMPKLAGLLVGFAGVPVLVGPQALDVRGGVGVPHLAVIAAAISYAGAAVYARRLCRTQRVVDVTAVKLLLGAALALAVATALDGSPAPDMIGAREIIALLALGVVSTGLGRLVYLWAIAKAGSVRASLVTYVMPVSAVALGWAVLGETIALSTIAGMGLIVGGVAVVLFGDKVLALRRREHADPRARIVVPQITIATRRVS